MTTGYSSIFEQLVFKSQAPAAPVLPTGKTPDGIFNIYQGPNYQPVVPTEIISFLPLKAVIPANLAKNFPDSIIINFSDDVFFQNSNGSGFGYPATAKNYYENALPALIKTGWIYLKSDGVYHVVGNNKPLNNFTLMWGTPQGAASLSNPPLGVSVTDTFMLWLLSPIYQGLGIPQNDINVLAALSQNKSGSDYSAQMVNTIGKYVVYAGAAIAGGYAAYTGLTVGTTTATESVQAAQIGGEVAASSDPLAFAAPDITNLSGAVSDLGLNAPLAGIAPVAQIPANLAGTVSDLTLDTSALAVPSTGLAFTDPSQSSSFLNTLESQGANAAKSLVAGVASKGVSSLVKAPQPQATAQNNQPTTTGSKPIQPPVPIAPLGLMGAGLLLLLFL